MQRYILKSDKSGFVTDFASKTVADYHAGIRNASLREQGLPNEFYVVDTGQPKPKRATADKGKKSNFRKRSSK
jgi:hypothetical protein